MGFGDHRGYARADPYDPRAMGECDRCRAWYNLHDLRWQYQWSGANLINLRLLVCKRCLDVPFEQYRVLILPGDPIPKKDPRPSPMITPPGVAGYSRPAPPQNQGFTNFQLGLPDNAGLPAGGAPSQSLPTPDWQQPGLGTPNYQTGPVNGRWPLGNYYVLQDIAALSGVDTPPGVIDRSVTFSEPGVVVDLFPANPTRTWLLIYSPTAAPAVISTGTAVFGAPTVLPMGPGQAYFWATAQGLGTVYQGAMTAAGLISGSPLWAFESSGTGSAQYMQDGSGNIMEDGAGNLMEGV